MCVCKKCMTIGGAVFLVLGLLYLLADLKLIEGWNFWNIQWYTALFLAVGAGHLASSKCPDCEVARTGKMGKK